MTARSPIAFEERGGGRLVAKLGVWDVGEVTPFPQGDRFKAHWRVAPLHDGAAAQQRRFPAPDTKEAQRRLEQYLLDWIDGSGLQLMPRDQIRSFRSDDGANGAGAKRAVEAG